MIEKIKHHPNNWVDGMKVSKDHFKEEALAFIDLIRDSMNIRLNDFNFGLFPNEEPGRESFDININSDIVEVHYCRGITRGGLRIEVLQKDIEGLRRPTHELIGESQLPKNTEWYVILRVNPFERVPLGEPNPAESPLRHPYTAPKYSLEIVPVSQINMPDFSHYALPLAKLKGDSGSLQIMGNYIPPCCTVGGSQELVNCYRTYERQLKEIEGYAFNIINKIRHKRKKNERGPLANDIYLLSQKIVEYIAQTYDSYRMRYLQETPLLLIEYFVKIARVIRTAMKLMEEQDGMMEYFRHYVEQFQPALLDDSLERLCSLNYSHLDIRKPLDEVGQFLTVLLDLFSRLVELDYTRLARHDIVNEERFISGQRTPSRNPIRKSAPKSDIRITPSKKDREDKEENPWNLK